MISILDYYIYYGWGAAHMKLHCEKYLIRLAVFFGQRRCSCETSEEWIRFYFFRQDLQDWRDFIRLRRGALSAEGRFIPMILLILSNFLLWNRFAPSSLKMPAPAKRGGGIRRIYFFWIPGFAGQARRARENYAVKSRLKAAPTGCVLSRFRVQGYKILIPAIF